MALLYADRVLETSTTTGTGTYSLAGAVTGYQGFVAGIGGTNSCFYCAMDVDASGVPQGGWEVGLGTVTDASPDTLSRTTILASSNAGAAVNWGAGTRRIFITDPSAHVDLVRTAAYASRPTVGVAGRLFLPSNGFQIERDSGSAWVPWGPLFPLSDPNAATLAWINQGSAAVDATKGGTYLSVAANGGASWRIRKETAPATPYTLTVGFIPNVIGFNGAYAVLWRQSSDGKLVTINKASTSSALAVNKWTSPSAFSAAYVTITDGLDVPVPMLWFQISDDGANRISRVSFDGQNFIQIHTVGRTDFMTADEIGFAIFDNATYTTGMTVLSYLKT